MLLLFKINSELIPVFIGVLTAMTVLAFILIRFTGGYSIYIMLGVCLFISFILAFLTSMLSGWGKPHSNTELIAHFIIIFSIPCLLAALINYGVINTLKSHDLVTIKKVLFFFLISLVVFLYTTQYEKYLWTTAIKKESHIEIVNVNLYGVKKIKYHSSLFRVPKNSYYDINKNRKDDIVDIHKGMPNGFEILYYSQKEKKFYKEYFELPKENISGLMGNGLLFPILRKQNYNQINLIIKNNGIINLELSNGSSEITFFEGLCGQYTKSELSESDKQMLKFDEAKIMGAD